MFKSGMLKRAIAPVAAGAVAVAFSPAIGASTDDHRLPWANGETWRVVQGHHRTNAWDFQPPGTGLSRNNVVVAVADGTARITCEDSAGQAIVSLQTSQGMFRYGHLQTSGVKSAGITTSGVTVKRGQSVGRLHPSPPSTDPGCGWATPAGASHLHLQFPRVPSTLQDVTFSTSGPKSGSLTSTNALGVVAAPARTHKNVGRSSDFDGDGRADFLTVGTNGVWRVAYSAARGNAWPKYATVHTNAPVADPGRLFVGDFDGDGRSDVAHLQSDGTWRVTYANKRGSAWSPFTTVHSNTRPNVNRVWVGDFDGDGRDDFLTVGTNGTWQVAYSAARGNAWPKYATVHTNTPVPDPSRLFVGDFDGDGRSDVAHLQSNGTWRVTYANKRGSAWSGYVTVHTNTTPDARRVWVGDFDGDGRDDFLVIGTNNVWRVAHAAARGYTWPKYATVHTNRAIGDPARLFVGDVDGDKRSDVTLVESSGTWRVTYARPAGSSWTAHVTVHTNTKPDPKRLWAGR